MTVGMCSPILTLLDWPYPRHSPQLPHHPRALPDLMTSIPIQDPKTPTPPSPPSARPKRQPDLRAIPTKASAVLGLPSLSSCPAVIYGVLSTSLIPQLPGWHRALFLIQPFCRILGAEQERSCWDGSPGCLPISPRGSR